MKTSLAIAFCLLLATSHLASATLNSPKLANLFQDNTPYTVTNDFWASFKRSVVGWQAPSSNCLDNFGSWVTSLSLIYLSLISMGTNLLTEGFSIYLIQDMLTEFLTERCYFFTTLGDLSLTLAVLGLNQQQPVQYSPTIFGYIEALATLTYLLFAILSVLLNTLAFAIDFQNLALGVMPRASLGFMAGDLFKGIMIVAQKNWIYE